MPTKSNREGHIEDINEKNGLIKPNFINIGGLHTRRISIYIWYPSISQLRCINPGLIKTSYYAMKTLVFRWAAHGFV